jgi:hypothetical protein
MKRPFETITATFVDEARTTRAEPASDWRDRLGICLSVLCLVHCLLTPLLLGLVPVGAALGFWQHGFHQIFLLIVPFVALIAFIPGWKRHRDARVWYRGITGIVFLALGVAVAEHFGHGVSGAPIEWAPLLAELALTVAGGACLIRAHLLNRELCTCCEHDHQHAVTRST